MRKEGSRELNGSCIPKLYDVSAGAASTPVDLWLLPHGPWRGDACHSLPTHNPGVRLTAAGSA